MTNVELKKVIADLKKHIEILGFNLYKISSIKEKDGNLETCKVAHKYMDDILKGPLSKLDQHLTEKISQYSKEQQLQRLSKINISKDKSMKETEKFFKTREALIGHAIKKGSKKQSKSK